MARERRKRLNVLLSPATVNLLHWLAASEGLSIEKYLEIVIGLKARQYIDWLKKVDERKRKGLRPYASATIPLLQA